MRVKCESGMSRRTHKFLSEGPSLMVESECVGTDSQDSFRMTVSYGGEEGVSELTHRILSE